jgi:Ni,Fe-hydrogenase III component G
MKAELRKKLEELQKEGVYRVNCITGVDHLKEIEIIYHLTKGNELLTLREHVPKTRPEIKTISDLFPGALLFERELAEMLGVTVKGITKKRFLLPDNWPEGVYPLRKNYKLEKPK